MARAAAGDRAAFGILTRRHLRRSLSLAQRVAGNPSDAEEIVQDAFMQVWANAHRWRGEGTRFTTWLYRIVMNRAIDYRRRPTFRPIEDGVEVVDPEDGADVRIGDRQLQAAVDAAIAALPERQRAALSLCYYGDMSCAEASKVMEISVSAMESLLVRARRLVRDRMRAVLNLGTDDP